MKKSRRQHPTRDQMSLLDWQPTSPVVAYVVDRVKASTLARTISKAVSETLKSCGRTRAEVAEAMTDYLGETVTENVLNAYASESRDDLIINITRLDALLATTKDRRLLELIAARHGWAVIERRHLPAIEMAEMMEARARMDSEIEYRRRQLKTGGGQ